VSADAQGKSATITADEILAHIKVLASDAFAGRQAGSKGAEKAAEYVASQFQSYRLKPVGDKGTFRQAFSFVGGVKLGPKNVLRFDYRNQVDELRPGEDFSPLAFSNDQQVESELVFVGYGIAAPELNHDDYAGVDVHGKLVMMLKDGPDGDNPHSQFQKYTAPRYKSLTAREKGAKGIIFISSEEKFIEDRLSVPKYDQSFGESGLAAVMVSRQAAERILGHVGANLNGLQKMLDSKKTSQSFGVPQLRVTCRTDIVKEMKTTANVVGLLEGRDSQLKNEFIVVGAHYDHLGLGGESSLSQKPTGEIHNGADDNASGVAGLLELAQTLTSTKEQLKRSVLFIAFSGEEEGLLGSSHYVKNPKIPLTQTVAMINFDMIGRLKGDSLVVYGIGTSPIWRPMLDRLNERARFDLKLNEDGVGPSDHTSFYLKDVPVLHFFTGVHEDYHKPSDDAERINAEGERRVLELAYQIVQALNDQPERPLFTKTKTSEQERAQSGFRVYIGTIPDYAEQAEGVKLAGVRDGSPAEKAGLKAGDVIVRVGARDVRNVYDYTYALQDLKAGEEVTFVVVRGSERVSLKLAPERRR
jgi:hypothetical protein